MKHKLSPFVAGMALTLALLAPASQAAPGESPASTESGRALPAQDLSADCREVLRQGGEIHVRGDVDFPR